LQPMQRVELADCPALMTKANEDVAHVKKRLQYVR